MFDVLSKHSSERKGQTRLHFEDNDLKNDSHFPFSSLRMLFDKDKPSTRISFTPITGKTAVVHTSIRKEGNDGKTRPMFKNMK